MDTHFISARVCYQFNIIKVFSGYAEIYGWLS